MEPGELALVGGHVDGHRRVRGLELLAQHVLQSAVRPETPNRSESKKERVKQAFGQDGNPKARKETETDFKTLMELKIHARQFHAGYATARKPQCALACEQTGRVMPGKAASRNLKQVTVQAKAE